MTKNEDLDVELGGNWIGLFSLTTTSNIVNYPGSRKNRSQIETKMRVYIMNLTKRHRAQGTKGTMSPWVRPARGALHGAL